MYIRYELNYILNTLLYEGSNSMRIKYIIIILQVFLIGCKTEQAALIGSSTTRLKEIYDYTYVRNDRHSQYPVKYRTIQYLEKKATDGQEVRLAVITLPEKIYDSSNIETIERPNRDFGLIALLSELQILWKEKHKKPFILIERKLTPQILEEIELSLSEIGRAHV